MRTTKTKQEPKKITKRKTAMVEKSKKVAVKKQSVNNDQKPNRKNKIIYKNTYKYK